MNGPSSPAPISAAAWRDEKDLTMPGNVG
jgi:hypothetical protein